MRMLKIIKILEDNGCTIKNNSETFVFAQAYINNKTIIVRCVKIHNKYELEVANFNNFKIDNLSVFESENESSVIENVLTFINNM